MPKGFVGVRLDEDLLKQIDGIAKANRLSRSKVIRNLLTASVSSPYKLLQDSSREEFSAELLGYLGSLDFHSQLDLLLLREWLLDNPYDPKAPERVRAVIAHYWPALRSKLSDDAKRLEEVAEDDENERKFKEFRDEMSREADRTAEEDITDGD